MFKAKAVTTGAQEVFEDPCAEFLGVDAEGIKIGIGYDYCGGYARDYSDEERREIADAMIKRWERFAQGPVVPHCGMG